MEIQIGIIIGAIVFIILLIVIILISVYFKRCRKWIKKKCNKRRMLKLRAKSAKNNKGSRPEQQEDQIINTLPTAKPSENKKKLN